MVWKLFYNTKSFLDKGTLCHLRNVINRRNISASGPDDFSACDDFFVLVVKCHIIVAAMEYLEMKSISDMPIHFQLTDELWLESKDKREDVLITISKEIALMYGNINANSPTEEVTGDKVQCYAMSMLSLGLLYMEYCDSIREGDGHRILRCWRYLMLVFKTTKRKNYSIEALNLLAQYHFFLSQRQAQQLIWSRCINTHGISGRNIPADLFMEHLNRVCKEAVLNLGSNKTPQALERVGKCVGVVAELLDEYDQELGIRELSGSHSIASSDKDKMIIVQQLLQAKVFSHMEGRVHSCFEKIRSIVIDTKDVKKWMKKQLKVIKNTLN